MIWTEVFIADDRLRPIWRFVLSLVLVFAAVVISGEFVGLFFVIARIQPTMWMAALGQSTVTLGALIASYKLLTAVFERRPLGSVGWAFHSRWWRELLCGLLVGAAMLGVAVGLEWACGLARFTFSPHPVLGAGGVTFLLFGVAAANEESIFRGYPFQRLIESITPVGAIALSSLLFGIVHLGNPHRTWISTLNTALVGVPFAIAYLRTRALWMPIGMHFIWNFLLGFFLGLPVSGLDLPGSVLTAQVRGPAWLTGGSYGPEGGLLAMAAILACIVYLLLSKSIYTTEDMKALVLAPVDARWPEPPLTIFSAPPDGGTQNG